MINSKYFQGRYQARMTEKGPDQGYYEVIDTERNNFVIGYGFLSLNDAYASAFQMNEAERNEAERKAAIQRNGLGW